MKIKELTPDKVRFIVRPTEAMESVERGLSFEFTGADHSEWINKVNENPDNIWLWCDVEVVASFQGLEGKAYLGSCAYETEQDFINGGYYDQMCEEAFNDLKSSVDAIVKPLVIPSLWERALSLGARLRKRFTLIDLALAAPALTALLYRIHLTL